MDKFNQILIIKKYFLENINQYIIFIMFFKNNFYFYGKILF